MVEINSIPYWSQTSKIGKGGVDTSKLFSIISTFKQWCIQSYDLASQEELIPEGTWQKYFTCKCNKPGEQLPYKPICLLWIYREFFTKSILSKVTWKTIPKFNSLFFEWVFAWAHLGSVLVTNTWRWWWWELKCIVSSSILVTSCVLILINSCKSGKLASSKFDNIIQCCCLYSLRLH